MLPLLAALASLLPGSPTDPPTAAPGAAQALVLHVAPDGDDRWSGRLGRPAPDGSDGPLSTPARAQERVREERAAGQAGDVTVRLAAGVYRLAEPLLFGPEDGAASWEAAPGARVVLSGARRLDDWAVEGDGTWAHAVGDLVGGGAVRQLFVAGQRRPRARTPDEGWLRVEEGGPDGRTSLRYPPGALADWPDLTQGELVLLHDWSMSRVGLGAVDEQTRTLTLADPVGPRLAFFTITNWEPHPRFALENLRAAWDRPGEWLHERGAGRLRYRPLPGEVPGSVDAQLPALERLVELRGEPGRPVRGLRFVGLTFAHTRAADPPHGFAGLQAGFHELRPDQGAPTGDVPSPAAVLASGAVDCAFERCGFERLGGTGLWLGLGCRDSAVRGCTFRDIGATGVMIGEPGEPAAGDSGSLVSRVALEDNQVERCGVLDLGAVGVWIGIAERVAVRHNELRDLPYTGVSLGWIWDPRPSPSREHSIERNHIHHVMQALSDGGGVYTLGRQPGTRIGENLIHDVRLNAGRAGSNGMFIDEGSTALLIEDNVIHSIARQPIRFHRAGANVLRGNVLVAATGVGAFEYNACSPDDKVFEDNRTPDPATWRAPTAAALGVGPRAGGPPTGTGDDAPSSAVARTPHFTFHSHELLNLHHFLYQCAKTAARRDGERVAGRPVTLSAAELGAVEGLQGEERDAWQAAVDFYRRDAIARDLLFDATMQALKRHLVPVEDPDGDWGWPADLDPEYESALRTALPVYRGHVWAAHDATNRAWITAAVERLARHETELVERMTAAYGGRWPEPTVRVDVCAYANWAGAYTTGGPALVTLASTDPDAQGDGALEILVHEASHTHELFGPLQAALTAAFEERGATPPRDLWHLLIFLTAGEAVERTLAADGSSGYRHYGERTRLYGRGPWATQHPLVAAPWSAFLDGTLDRSAALARIAEALAR